MAQEITYVKPSTLNFGEAIKKTEKGELEVTRGQKKVADGWASFVVRGTNEGWFEGFNPNDKVESIRDAIQAKNHDTLLAEVELPKNGMGVCRRTGKMIPIVKGGEVKWAAWRLTRKFTTYPGDIAKVIKAGLTDELVKEDCAIGRSAILKMVKEVEDDNKSALSKFQESLETAKKIYKTIDPNDNQKALTMLDAFINSLN